MEAFQSLVSASYSWKAWLGLPFFCSWRLHSAQTCPASLCKSSRERPRLLFTSGRRTHRIRDVRCRRRRDGWRPSCSHRLCNSWAAARLPNRPVGARLSEAAHRHRMATSLRRRSRVCPTKARRERGRESRLLPVRAWVPLCGHIEMAAMGNTRLLRHLWLLFCALANPRQESSCSEDYVSFLEIPWVSVSFLGCIFCS